MACSRVTFDSYFYVCVWCVFDLSGGWEHKVSIVTVPPAGWSWVRTLVGTNIFSLLQDVQSGSGAHPTFYLMGASIHYQDKSGQGM